MSDPNGTANNATNASSSPANYYYDHSVELFDLGRERFDQDTAGITDRDYSLLGNQAVVVVRAGRAPRGLESQVHAWNRFQYTTDEGSSRNDVNKGDMHGGLLHRENRAARDALRHGAMGCGGGRVEKAGGEGRRHEDALCAGTKPDHDAPPLAKGMAEEMDKSMFWDAPLL